MTTRDSTTAPASSFGLLATTRYVPRLRLERTEMLAQHRWMAPGLRGLAKGQKAIASWDEDSVTMAVEAGRRLARALPQAMIGEFTLASTTLPFADRLNAGIAAAALGLEPSARVRDVASSSRAALGELAAALQGPHNGTAHLVVAAERRTPKPASVQEMIFGDGAAAALVGKGEPIATLLASRSTHADLVDHFRETGQAHDYGWEERWVRDEGYLKIAVETIRECLAAANINAGDVAHFAMPAPLARVNDAVAKRLGVAPPALVSTEHETVGDLGGAQPLAMLDIALRAAAPGALILVAAFGSGCDALLLRRSAAPCPGAAPDPGRPFRRGDSCMRGLKGKTAIVTGAGSGIGRAITQRLGAEGVTVGVFDINAKGAGETVQAIETTGGKALAVACDITDYAAVAAAVAEFEAQAGKGTDVLVNNAGWDTPMPFLKTDAAFWKKVTAINWFGPLHMTHAVAQGMVARKGGRIVNIASDAGRVGSSGEVVYSGCKGATIAFAKALAREVARAGITINTVCPGPTDTPAMDAFVGTGEAGQKIRDAMVRGVPLGRIGQPDDYPGLVAFLASDDAAFMTGQTISVSGGLSMHG